MVDCVSITLLRHGLTNENVQKRYVGWTDVGLNEKGISELQQFREKNYPKPDYIFTSDLVRCMKTSEILFANQMYEASSLFREYHFGDWELKTYDDLKENQLYRNWIDSPSDYRPPQGETFIQFKERVLQGWDKLMIQFKHPEVNHMTLVTHGGVIRLLLSLFAPVEKDFWQWSVLFGEGVVLEATRNRMRGGGRCTSYRVVPLMENSNGC
jgi:alpha-ribazole phosphatase